MSKEKKKKQNGGIGKIFLIIIAILLVVILLILGVIYAKLSKIQVKKLDEENLDINPKIYEEVSDLVSKEEFDDIVNIALFGSDSRDIYNESAGRSDCIMIASINPVKKSMKLISIPRDSYVNVPGYGDTKINHAYAYGGEQLAIKTINNNFDLNISEYITIDFSGLIHVINQIGGIELDITKEELTVLNQYLQASYQLTGKSYTPMTEYGHVKVNGEQALAHARNRYVGNDFERARRQRDVVTAVIHKISTMNASAITSLVSDSFLAEVKTNIQVTSYLGLLTSILADKSSYLGNLISVQVPSTVYGYDKYVDGIYYFGFDKEMAKKDIFHYIYEK